MELLMAMDLALLDNIDDHTYTEKKKTWSLYSGQMSATCLVETLIPDFTRIKTFPPSTKSQNMSEEGTTPAIQSIPLPMIRELVGEGEGVKQAHLVDLGLAADDEKETAVPTCPSPPPRPRRPDNWKDTYSDTQSKQGPQAAMAIEEAVPAHTLTNTAIVKSKKEEGPFVDISLNLGEMGKEGGQETGAKGHNIEGEERWGIA